MNKKQIKKTEKQIIEQLTKVCHLALAQIEGFVWLTHTVDYDQLESSLMVVCVFDTQASASQAQLKQQQITLKNWIVEHLKTINIYLNKPDKQIKLDNEQACEAQHQGNWQVRLEQL